MNRPSCYRAFLAAGVLLMLVGAAPAGKPKDEDPNTVTIKNLKYDPASLTVKSGQTVTWINKDDNDHTVIGDDADSFKSENISAGEKFQHTFKKAGKYPYHCKYHPRMKAVIIVE